MIDRVPLNELVSKVIDNRGRTCPTADDGMPLIATNCVHNTGLYPTFEKIRHIDQATYENWFRGHPEPGDLIFVLKGTPGRVCLTPDPVTFCIAQDMVALRADPDLVDPAYLFAALRSPETQEAIGNLHVGSMIAHFKKGDFNRLIIPLPEREIQESVGRFYLDVSRKIELNRRMSATLEEMARALYRSWFVDFDPVHARALGQSPAHMDPTTAALFPDNFGPDGLPKEWEWRSLDEIADFLNGAALQKFPAEAGAESLPVIKIAELRSGITPKSNRAGLQVPEKYKIFDGDVLFSWSGSLLQKVWTEGPGALNQHLFKVTSEGVPKWLHFFAVDQHMEEFRQVAASKATTMGHIQRHHLKEAMIAMPRDKAIIKAAGEIIRPAFNRAVAADLEIQTLAALRDALLPRLMSGELRIREAEKHVEEVV